jgi:hypothetical protein
VAFVDFAAIRTIARGSSHMAVSLPTGVQGRETRPLVVPLQHQCSDEDADDGFTVRELERST